MTWLPGWQIRELIFKREVSPVGVTDHYLGTIEEHGATLQALLHVDTAGGREQAQRAEAAIVAGEALGPLHGIPVSVQSHVDVAGLPKLTPTETVIANHDHLAVERLRAAGAVIVGHNTMMDRDANEVAKLIPPWPSRFVPH